MTGSKRKHSDMTAEDVAAALEGHRPAWGKKYRATIVENGVGREMICSYAATNTLDQLLDDLDITQPLHRKALMDFFGNIAAAATTPVSANVTKAPTLAPNKDDSRDSSSDDSSDDSSGDSSGESSDGSSDGSSDDSSDDSNKPAATPAAKLTRQQELALKADGARPDPEDPAHRGGTATWQSAQAAWVASWEGPSPPATDVTGGHTQATRREWWKEAKLEHGALVAAALAAGATRPPTKAAAKADVTADATANATADATADAKADAKADATADAKADAKPAPKPARAPATAAQLEMALAAVPTRPDPKAASYKNNTAAWHHAQAVWVASWGGDPPPKVGRGGWWKWSKWLHGQLAAEAQAAAHRASFSK